MHPMFVSVFVVAVVATQCAARLQEPACGSYELFERLLTKLLNIENKVEKFESTMAQWEARDEVRAVEMTNTSAIVKTMASRLEAAETRLQEQTAAASVAVKTMASRIEAAETRLVEKTDVITTTLETALQKHEQELQTFQQAYKTPTVFFTATHVDDRGITKGKVIKFTTLVNNEGDGYDKNTGKFTAPHDGLYLFQVTVCSKISKQVFVHLLAANRVIGATYKYNTSGDSGTCTSMSGMATLSAGDEAWVQGGATRSGVLHDNTYTWQSFSGMLVHK